MMISNYILGAGTKSDRDLYAWTGHWLLDRKLHEELGVAITSLPGDVWHVMKPKEGRARGFTITRDNKDKSSRHLRMIHADTEMAHLALLSRVIETAKTDGVGLLWAKEKRENTIFAKAGFKMIEAKDSGRNYQFVRWELKTGEQDHA